MLELSTFFSVSSVDSETRQHRNALCAPNVSIFMIYPHFWGEIEWGTFERVPASKKLQKHSQQKAASNCRRMPLEILKNIFLRCRLESLGVEQDNNQRDV